MFRIGLGVDSHRFEETPSGKKLVLGGIVFPNEVGFVSHSDGDVVLHALFNALSSAIGEKSIGEFFPDTHGENMGKNSRDFIEFILPKIAEKNFQIENVVVSLECKKPKISPHSEQMKQVISKLLGISIEQIAVHATTGEGLTSFGKGEGVYGQVIVLLVEKKS